MSTPELHLKTVFTLNEEGHIASTREPMPSLGPAFYLVRGTDSCAWAVRADVAPRLADKLSDLARQEPPISDLRDAPMYAERYMSLVGGRIESGPALAFPDVIAQPADTVIVDDIRLIDHNFSGWVAEEVPGRSPIVAVFEDGYPASVCFCARRSQMAAEAGLETAAAFRGRGFGPRVTAAWALAIRKSGRVPLYSTSWTNTASLAVVRKLGLVPYAATWSLSI